MALTTKQEAFCQAYIETGNATEAYRRAYDAEGMKPATTNRKAKELCDHGKITARLDQLRDAHAKRHEMTVSDIVGMLKEDRDFARELETPAAAISATLGMAKLFGLLTDKHDHKSSDGSMTPPDTSAAIIAALERKHRDT